MIDGKSMAAKPRQISFGTTTVVMVSKWRAGIGTHQQLLVYMKLLTSVYAAVAAVDNKGAPIDASRHVRLKQKLTQQKPRKIVLSCGTGEAGIFAAERAA
jgi:hypothetical protein